MKFHFFLDRVARFTGDGDFLGDDGAVAFFPPRLGAGDFFTGDALVFFAVFLGSGDLAASEATGAALLVARAGFFSGLLLADF